MQTERQYSINQVEENPFFLSVFEALKPLLAPMFRYKQGNCHNLTHYASLILKKQAVSHQKIWIFAPSRYQKESKVTINVADPNQLSLSGRLHWGYHVALLVEQGGQSMVLDYFINENQPLSQEEWRANFGQKEFKVEIHEAEKYLFYGEEQANTEYYSLYNGTFFGYEGECRVQQWIPFGLATNETVCLFIENEQEYLEEHNLLSKDYRRMIGNIENFECIFRDFSVNKRMNKIFQQKHQQIIAKYRRVFAEKLEKWNQQIEALL
jgi:hypothetical protein